MALFAIGDLHLALSTDKPMDIFPGWDGYMERLEANWRALVSPGDTVVVAGDVSWAMRLDHAQADFLFLESLPGKKLLMKGNHDYWWTTRTKMEGYFDRLGLKSLGILHNNAVTVDGIALCGSRGWLFENGAPHDRKIVEREACRIEASLAAAPPESQKLLLLHYPPYYCGQELSEFFDLMEQYGVTHCFYGHLHGPALASAYAGSYRGVELVPISADYLGFSPLKLQVKS